MALQMNYYVQQYEVTKTDCYWKIELENGIQGGKEKLRARLSCYKDRATADTNQNKYADYDVEFVPDLNSSLNFIAQAYDYAKTTPMFSSAVDV